MKGYTSGRPEVRAQYSYFPHQIKKKLRGKSMGNHRNAKAQPENTGVNLSRRNLMQRAGWTVAAAAFPSGVFAADSISPVMAKLSTYMREAGGRALPDQVVV